MKKVISILMLTTSALLSAQSEQDLVFTQKVDTLAASQMKQYGIVGAGIAVFTKEQVVLSKGYGYSDLQQNQTASENTIFRIASITKVFTAIAVMQLYQAGKIDLNKPVDFYLPALKMKNPHQFRPITVRDLLTHTAGLTDAFANGDCCDKPAAQQDIIPLLNQEIRTIPPGLKKNYSNAGYALLGCLIESISGKSYESYIKDAVFQPLNMQHSSIGLQPAWAQWRTKGYLTDSTVFEMPAVRDLAAGGIESSLSDMVAFAQVLLNQGKTKQGSLLSEAVFQEMTSNQIGHVTLQTEEMFGYGLFIKPLGTDKDAAIGNGLGHAGNMRNHHAILMVYPKANVGILVMANSEQGSVFSNVMAISLIRQYLKIYQGMNPVKAPAAQFAAATLSADRIDHNRIKGIYGGGGEDYVQIKKINQQKLKFKQAGNTLILKRNDNNVYTVKYLLLKMFPVKIKQVMFAFKQEGNEIYLKTIDTSRKTSEYISKKDPDAPPADSWKQMEGNYEIVNLYTNTVSMMPRSLKIEHNKLILYRKDTVSDAEDSIGFYPLSKEVAVADGVDRGAGANLQILPNGNLYFSGFEMKKVQ